MKLGISQHGVKYVLKTSEETGQVKDKRSGAPERNSTADGQLCP